MVEENENINSTNDEEENVNSTNDNNDTSEVEETEDVETLKEQNKKLFERAKKAEGFVRDENGKWIKKPQPKIEAKPEEKPEAKEPVISIADLHALRDVHEDDIAEVQEYAKFKNISIKEALKSTVIKTLLAEKKEQRNTAEATNVSNTRRSFSKPSTDQILEKAAKGEYPDDPAELARARTAKQMADMKRS